MFEIDLKKLPQFNCIRCDSSNTKVKNVQFIGISTVAFCSCSKCACFFYHTLPLGHSFYYPISFSPDKKRQIFDNKVKQWFAIPLINATIGKKEIQVEIEKWIINESDSVIVLNCLDTCYGHVLSKLLNSVYYLKKGGNYGLVLIIPERFRWLIPEGVSEVWIVKGPLKNLNCRLKDFDSYVKEELKRYENVLLSPAFLHHDYTFIRLDEFLKIEKFDLNKFDREPPIITFIWREDRLILRHPFFSFLHKIQLKTQSRLLFLLLIFCQKRFIEKTVMFIKKEFKEASFNVIGIGKSGSFSRDIRDLREKEVDTSLEKVWLKEYSKSQVVIGVHGSNMLLPTALAGSFINLLPREKIRNYSEDIIYNKNPQFALYLGRTLDLYSAPSLLARHVIAMIYGFPQLLKENKISV